MTMPNKDPKQRISDKAINRILVIMAFIPIILLLMVIAVSNDHSCWDAEGENYCGTEEQQIAAINELLGPENNRA